MDGLDFFSPSSASESYDPAAFERFKEQIKKNAQIAAAIRKSEQKQKQKEDALAKILQHFIQTNQNSVLMMLVAQLLEQNIPASFVLAIIILGNDDIKAAIREHEAREAQLALPEKNEKDERELQRTLGAADMTDAAKGGAGEFSLITRFNDATVPLNIKIALDEWGVGIYQAGTGQPFRVLETVLDKEGHIKKVVNEACATVLQHFLVSQDSAAFATRGYESFYSFSEFMMKGILQKLKEQVEDQKQLN